MNRWSRVRQACQTGELESKDFFEVDSRRRQRRNALADTSAVPLTVPSSSQRLHFHELVERVRELQNEIVPDLKFQSNRTNLSSSLPTNNGTLFNYENGRLSICSSGSTTSRSRLSLSSRILERAHQIPERFWIDWQQKQMQDQIEELEQIKNNLASTSNLSLGSVESDEKFERTSSPIGLDRPSKDRFERTSSQSLPSIDDENLAQNSFSFDRRSDDENETCSDTKTLVRRRCRPHSHEHRVLPFTYTGEREPIVSMIDSRIYYLKSSSLEKSDFSSDKLASNKKNCFLSDLKREKVNHHLTSPPTSSTRSVPIKYQRRLSIQRTKTRPISTLISGKENDNDQSSPTLSYRSALSRLSSFEFNDSVTQSNSVIQTSRSSLSASDNSSNAKSLINQSANETSMLPIEKPMSSRKTFAESSCSVSDRTDDDCFDNETNETHVEQMPLIISHERTWKLNGAGSSFNRKVFALNNNEKNDETDVVCSSSSAATTTAVETFVSERSARRQLRKQTTLKKKIQTSRERAKNEKKKKKMKKERNKKSTSSGDEATEASLFHCFARGAGTSSDPHQYRNDATKKNNCFSISSSNLDKQVTFHSRMERYENSSPRVKRKKENVRVFLNHRRPISNRRFRRRTHQSQSSERSDETSSLQSDSIEQLVGSIKKQLRNYDKSSSRRKNVIVVNYRPVFVDTRRLKKQGRHQQEETNLPKHKESRRRNSDSSVKPSSMDLNVPDVEDPLQFIELMYQQLFTEDGRLRRPTEPSILANCVKQIVNHSRRNSMSSPLRQKTNSSSSLARSNLSISTMSSSQFLTLNDQFNSFGEEENDDDDQAETLVQTHTQQLQTELNKPLSKLTRKNSRTHSLLSTGEFRTNQVNTNFRLSLDDTDNEELDTFSEFNSARSNIKVVRTSPSLDEDLTHTDSRILSSSGYHSIEQSTTHPFAQKPKQATRFSKSFSESDLNHSSDSEHQLYSQHCPNCLCSSSRSVINIREIPKSDSPVLRRFQHPLGEILMKYFNFLLISKNVLLLPLVIFLLRQRTIYLGH